MRVTRLLLVGGGIVLASILSLLSGCSTVAIFDAVVPKDGGAILAKSGIAYDRDPRNTLDIYTPEPARPHAPVIVFMYGGSWSSGNRADYSFAGRAFAARGFVTVIPDTRLVPQIRYPAFIEDGAHALRWVHDHIAEYGGDPRRIYLVGHSSGAYNTVMLALEPRFLREVALDRRVIKAVAALSGPYDFLPLDVNATRDAFGRVSNLEATQPVNLASKSAPPIFLATGSADTLVYPRNTTALARKLREAGAVVEAKIYPGISHSGTVVALSRPFRSDAPVLDDIVGFLDAFP
jgi:acetyl esterase/lipase